MEKFFLCTLFLGKEMNIIDQQHIKIPEFITEGGHGVCFNGIDHGIGKFLGGNIEYFFPEMLGIYKISNRLHQMGLTHSGFAVNE